MSGVAAVTEVRLWALPLTKDSTVPQACRLLWPQGAGVRAQ